MPIKIEIVTPERKVYTDEVDMVIAPGTEGVLGILPRHAPLLTGLKLGELRLKKGGEEIHLLVEGGFMEVGPDKVVIMADVAERAEEIDIARAQAAREKAEALLSQKATEIDMARTQASLQRALLRIRIAERRHRPRKGS